MKIVLSMTGGFAGIGGRWSVDIPADRAAGTLTEVKAAELIALVEACRKEGAFAKDFTRASSIAPGTADHAYPPVPDGQTFDLVVDNESVKWCEPALTGLPQPPASLFRLKDWIRQNLARTPNPLN